MMKHLLQVGRGPNNICCGIGCKMVKTWMICLLESTNDLGLAGWDLRWRILLTPMIAFDLCRELKSFHSGILDVGYVYHSKNSRKISKQSIRWALRKRWSFPFCRERLATIQYDQPLPAVPSAVQSMWRVFWILIRSLYSIRHQGSFGINLALCAR